MVFKFGDLCILNNDSIHSGELVVVCKYECTFIKDGLPTKYFTVMKHGEGYFTDSEGMPSKYTCVSEYELTSLEYALN